MSTTKTLKSLDIDTLSVLHYALRTTEERLAAQVDRDSPKVSTDSPRDVWEAHHWNRKMLHDVAKTCEDVRQAIHDKV